MTESLEIENIVINDEPIIKKKGYRIAEWRHLENGKYNNRPIDEKYFYNYFKEHYHHPVQCELCDRVLKCCDGLKRHQKTTM